MTDTIGLIAGNGIFPLLFARAARAQGMRVVAVALRGETRAELAAEVDAVTWLRVGQVHHGVDQRIGRSWVHLPEAP